MNKHVTLSIDGRTILADEGKNLVDVAAENDIFIPSLCYFKNMDQPLGTCRTCTCKVNGRYGPACTEKVREGMVIEVGTEELKDMRKALVEMMFAEGNHICPACEKSGDCDLQHMGYELGISVSRFPHLFTDHKIDWQARRMLLEHNRCIKCMRCVEEVRTDNGKRVFSYQNRGNDTLVGIDYEQEALLSTEQAREAMRICPTGAIIVRGESLGKPFGQRKFDMKSTRTDFIPQRAYAKSSETKEKKRIATTSLAGCFGCHMSMLDIDTELLELVELVEFDKSPINDIKKFSGRCDLGIIEGGCCNDENIETLRAFREHCDILVSVGECAIWGGLPAMRNQLPLGECLEEAYLNCSTNDAETALVPYHKELPKLLNRVYACREVVKIDYNIPGCPPDAQHIWKAVKNLLWGEKFSILYNEFKYD
ncbi:2Fe-2S iron-sulfur cluster-binding protein [Cyclonatronum sp.]|uniref:NADH-quinone oxidoreductase subunit B family protein n=1 Tax=Cyclonatronum sp. TaxID=3024185 RepID=UPI0025BA672B|nr:2Fe-2S iron-sulfur cluster-binding protein [Cyclonatronum sp.]MCC5932967.1 (2Fe-2S)-binding protein [Balneolales bacterium]